MLLIYLGREFHSFGAAYANTLSPNVACDLPSGGRLVAEMSHHYCIGLLRALFHFNDITNINQSNTMNGFERDQNDLEFNTIIN